METTYRRASIADYQILYDLNVEFEEFNKQHTTRPHEHFLEDWQKYFKEEITDSLKSRNSYVFLAFVDDKPAGYIYARLCKGCYAFIVEELLFGSNIPAWGLAASFWTW